MTKKPYKDWTKERVFEEARKYNSKDEFRNGCKSAYEVARKNGWLKEMNWLQRKKKWTKEAVFEEARKYQSRSEFAKGCGSAYQVTLKNGWLDKMDWFKDKRLDIINDKIDSVYRYYWEETNSIYIGRTLMRRQKDRDNEHSTNEEDTVFKYTKENGLAVPQMEIIEENITVIEGQEREDYWVKYYKKKGYNVLNIAKTGVGSGSLGAINYGKWTKEAVFDEARKYKTRTEFQKGCNSAYQAARKNGWLEEMYWLQGNKKWTKERVFEEARKYKTRKEFQKGCRGAYEVAWKNDWLDEMDWFKERATHNKKWTKEAVFEEGKKYKTRGEFQKGSPIAYQDALKNKWIEEMDWFEEGRKPNNYWTKERVFEEARKYKTRIEFAKGCGSAYNTALKNGWFEEMDWFVEIRRPRNYWTKESVFEEARKYETKQEFRKGNRGAYNAALKNGWLDELFPIYKVAA